MADDINVLAEKKLKTRMTKIRKCNRKPEKKARFSEKFGVSFEVPVQTVKFYLQIISTEYLRKRNIPLFLLRKNN